jgi:D-serine deaminase-like pyridoxal phosphate-dependent protein
VKRLALVVVLVGLGAGCARPWCPRPCAPPGPRHFLVLRATPMPRGADEEPTAFVETSVVEVSRPGALTALRAARPLASDGAPAWLAGPGEPDATFGPGARVLTSPRIVAIQEQMATVFVGEADREGAPAAGYRIEVTPTRVGAETRLVAGYALWQGGRVVQQVPRTTLEAPAGGVFLVEALPPR